MPPDLPHGSEVAEYSKYGDVYWTQTAAIKTKRPDGRTEKFFLKVCHYMGIFSAPDIFIIATDLAQ